MSDLAFDPSEKKNVGQICELINGRGFKPHEWASDGFPIIRIQNLNGSGDFNYFSGSFNQKIQIETGDLLFAWSGSRGTSFGPHIWRGPTAVLNYHTWKVRPRSSIDRAYLFHALKGITKKIEDEAHGASALVHTQKREMVHYEVWVPETDQQKAIAQALSDMDDLIASLDALIAKKRDIKQGAMQQLLTGKRRLPGFSGEWTTVPFRQALRVRHGKSQKQVEVESGTYPILATGGEIGRSNTPLYDKPSVLIGRKGTIDRPQYIDTPFWSVDTLFYTEIQRGYSPKYIYYAFQRIDWRSYNEASGVPSLNAKTIEDIEVALPEEPEQEAIVEVLELMDDETANAEAKREKLAMLRQGMMQQLLNGRIRLI
ncbi:MAG: restriction endonuclease subunit S [Pseudorhizobium sp.]